MTRLLGLAALAIAIAGFTRDSHAAFYTFEALLSGSVESPPNDSPGTGHTTVSYDPLTHDLRVQVTFQGLIGETTASHIHAATLIPGQGTAIVATELPSFVAFPLGVTSGSYDQLFDTSQESFYNPAFFTAHGGTVATAEAAFVQALGAGTAYLNIHTTFARGGEIRGFLHATPEPASVVMLGVGVLGMVGYRRLRRVVAA